VSVAEAVGAVLAAAAIGGCAAPPAALGTHTAQVTINGRPTGEAHRVTCSQFGWNWTIETLSESRGFTAMFQTGDTVTARSVQIRDLGGFTGSYWQYTVGDADASVAAGTFKIAGTAVGYTSERPTDTVPATFTIETSC
jgi:lipoprotein LpqH